MKATRKRSLDPTTVSLKLSSVSVITFPLSSDLPPLEPPPLLLLLEEEEEEEREEEELVSPVCVQRSWRGGCMHAYS
jgi:hypothetical protein